MPVTALIFTKTTMVQKWHNVESFCTEFHPDQSRNMENAGKFSDTCM